jgi:hypothetical protein
LLARNDHGNTPVDVAGTQKVANAILTHKLGTMSHENDRLSQEVHDLKNLVMATTFYGNMDRVDVKKKRNRTASPSRQGDQDQQQNEEREVDINKDFSMNSHKLETTQQNHGCDENEEKVPL